MSGATCGICRKTWCGEKIRKYSIPSGPNVRQRWEDICGRQFSASARICEKHFASADFKQVENGKRRRLKSGSVPSLFLSPQTNGLQTPYRGMQSDEDVEDEQAANYLDCCMRIDVPEKFSFSLNEINEQATCEQLTIESQTIQRDNIQSFCRTCLTSIAEHTVGHDLKYDVHKTKDLAQWINECTQLEVKLNDDFPKYLCHECYKKFESFIEFRATCTQSILLLKQVLVANNSSAKDPIELERETLTTQISENKCITAEKAKLSMEEEIVDPEDWWELEIINDVPVELKKIISRTHKELVGLKLENNIWTEEDSQRKIQPKLDSNDAIDFKNRSNEMFLCSTEFLESTFESESSEENILKQIVLKKHKQSNTAANSGYKVKSSKKTVVRFECERCHRCFIGEENLAAHLRDHHGGKPFQCSQCKQSFCRMSSFRKHNIIFHSDRKNNDELFACPFDGCGKQFQYVESYRYHYRTKHPSRQTVELEPPSLLICEVCGLTFKTKSKLNDHSYRHRPKEEYPFKCDKCDKFFIQKVSFEEHQLRHAGIKKYVCSYCGAGKTTRSELTRHVNTHTKAKQYPCPLCTRIFYKSSNLRKHHLLFHQRIRKYKCSHCGQCFGKADTLKNHVMRHTGEKPHECIICRRRFITTSSLQIHMKTHDPKVEKVRIPEDDIRNFKCSYCEKSFRTLNVLQNHELIHTGEKPHKCEMCGKCFRQLSALRYHLNWHERVDGRGSTGEAIRTGTYEKKKPKQQLRTDFTTLVT